MNNTLLRSLCTACGYDDIELDGLFNAMCMDKHSIHSRALSISCSLNSNVGPFDLFRCVFVCLFLSMYFRILLLIVQNAQMFYVRMKRARERERGMEIEGANETACCDY